MADKDEFKFDDDDAFPETDLSGAFAEGEQSAPVEPEYPMTIRPAGGSRTRLLLLLLLLVVVGGGAYYFLLMEDAPPPPPAKKVVAAVPKPTPPAAPAPAKPAQPAQPAQPVAPAVSSPQAGVTSTPASPPAAPGATAATDKTSVSVAPPPKPAAAAVPAKPPTVAVVPAAQPEVKPAPAPVAPVSPAPSKPVATASAAPPVKPAEVKPPSPVTAGPWLIEAGTYLNAAALKADEGKIRALGFEPQVSTFRKNVRLTRLRIGSVAERDLKDALTKARTIAPEAFALRAGESYTVYAGTFANPQNLRRMSERLAGQGITAEEEPMEVMRTISLLRFGGFADQAAATEAASRARRAGIAAEVITSD